MAKSLVIVESPTKAKTLKKYMGRGYDVRASVGHLVDLPKSKLGVDIEHNFEPSYTVIRGKNDVLKELKKAAKDVDRVVLATDPDREGEAIAWHIARKLESLGKPIERVEFNEITKRAVLEALKHPRKLDENRFEAQQARRVLDRLVGYLISPLLWAKVRRGLSAGRVQSVALRLVVEREREIQNFQPQEYWTIDADLAQAESKKGPVFRASLQRIDGEKVEIATEAEAGELTAALKSAAYKVEKVEKKERRRRPAPPFTTSLLQQEAARKLRFPAKKTMMLAQRLYEGIDVGGEEGTVGLITYMRTDSFRLAGEALAAIREHIGEQYGEKYLPEKPNIYKARKGAQEAHEAIRPTSFQYPPDSLKGKLGRDEMRLYKLIWQRTVASQMEPAVYDQTGVDIAAEGGEGGRKLTLRATGSILKFPGFTKAYVEDTDEGDATEDEADHMLPDLQEGEAIDLRELFAEQHFTQPPPRFTEASLVKALEEQGIGRPSTYAAILSNIQDKKYVTKQDNRFYPTEMGVLVTQLLVEHFPDVMDVEFTANMEEELDEIAEGKGTYTKTVKDFYGPFSKRLEKANVEMRNVKQQAIRTDVTCEKCGAGMLLKWGRFGEFLACERYPDCDSTSDVKRGESGEFIPVKPGENAEPYPGNCPKCGESLTLRKAWTGSRYIACKKYKDGCDYTKSFPIGVTCPECNGDLVERASRRKRIFYGCDNYPTCNFVAWYKPIDEKCPDCGHPFLYEKTTKRKGHHLACPNKECKFERILDQDAAPETTGAKPPEVPDLREA